MIGMYPPNKDDGSVRPSSTGMFQSLASDARSLAHEEVGPGTKTASSTGCRSGKRSSSCSAAPR